jgi:hypothetical protein
MSAQPRGAGGAPVGHLSDLPPLERMVVLCLRLWTAGAAGRDAVRGDLAARHGAPTGPRLFAALAELIDTTVRHARRPLLCHAPDCPCAGADEAVIARFVALAAEGAREDAILIATLLVRADLALGLAALAEEVGLGLSRSSIPETIPARRH